MKFTNESNCTPTTQDLKIIAKNQGGIGLEDSVVDWNSVGQLCKFLVNLKGQTKNGYLEAMLKQLSKSQKGETPNVKPKQGPEEKKDDLTEDTLTFTHCYKSEEQLFNVLKMNPNLQQVQKLIREMNQQIKLTYNNK